MHELLEKVEELTRVARTQRAQGQRADAAAIFKNGIDLLERSVQTVDPRLQQDVAEKLADLYGMLGGTLGEEGDLIRAIQAYDAGFEYESDQRYGIKSSYNALNRLITRILFNPRSLTDPTLLRSGPSPAFLSVSQELINLRSRLENEVTGSRSDDFWAAGDLALVCALIGDDEGAAKAVMLFDTRKPPPSAYEAYVRSVMALADLDTPRKLSLQRLQVLFDRRPVSC
jgi:hypothetical protein